jgi:hypothetical protein
VASSTRDDPTGIVPDHSGKDWAAEVAHTAAGLRPDEWKLREEVLAATLCLCPFENRGGAGLMATTVSPGVRKRVLEPQRGLIALSERIKCRSIRLTVTRWSRGVCHMGNLGQWHNSQIS